LRETGRRNPTARFLNLALLVASGGYFLLSRLDTLWSGGADLAFHTMLVSRHMEVFNVANVVDPALGPLGQYPQFAYIPAAIAGKLAGSPVIGIQVAALSALLLVWLFGAFAARTVPAGIAPVFLLVFSWMAVINDVSVRLELFGNEIVKNFFYAQLVGQAAAMGALLASVAMELRGVHPRWRYLLLVASIVLLVNIHLVPTLEMLGFIFLTVALDVWRASPSDRWKRLAEGGVAIAAALAFVLFHPAFTSAVSTSTNDGGLPLRYTPQPLHMAVLALIVGGLCAAALLAWIRWLDDEGRRQWSYVKVLSVFGLSAAGCCIAQYAALHAGYGSPYAVKKYAYALNTVLLLFLGLAIAARITVVLKRRRANPAFFSPRSSWTLACLAPLALIFSGLYRTPGQISVSRLAAVDEFARAYRALSLEASPGKNDYAVGVTGIRGGGNFLVSIDALHAPIDGNSVAVLYSKPLPNPAAVRYVLTSPGSLPWDVPECRKFNFSAGFVVLDGACVFARIGPGAVTN
jgi:hypothetical protein